MEVTSLVEREGCNVNSCRTGRVQCMKRVILRVRRHMVEFAMISSAGITEDLNTISSQEARQKLSSREGERIISLLGRPPPFPRSVI